MVYEQQQSPLSGASCLFPPVEQNFKHVNSKRTLPGTDPGSSFGMCFLLMAAQQILSSQVKCPLLGEHRLWDHACPSSYPRSNLLCSVALDRASNPSEHHPVKQACTLPCWMVMIWTVSRWVDLWRTLGFSLCSVPQCLAHPFPPSFCPFQSTHPSSLRSSPSMLTWRRLFPLFLS